LNETKTEIRTHPLTAVNMFGVRYPVKF